MPAIACCVMHWLGLGLGQSAGGTQVERTADCGVGLAPGRPEFRLFSDRRRHPARPENLLPSPVPVRLRHPELADRLALEVEFDQDRSLITDNPAIMTGLDDDNLGRRELDSAAVRILDVDLVAGQEPDVRLHAEIGADDRFHVFGPAKSRRVDDAFHAKAPARTTSIWAPPISRHSQPAMGARSGSLISMKPPHGLFLRR